MMEYRFVQPIREGFGICSDRVDILNFESFVTRVTDMDATVKKASIIQPLDLFSPKTCKLEWP